MIFSAPQGLGTSTSLARPPITHSLPGRLLSALLLLAAVLGGLPTVLASPPGWDPIAAEAVPLPNAYNQDGEERVDFILQVTVHLSRKLEMEPGSRN